MTSDSIRFPHAFKIVNYCLIYSVFSIGSIGEVCYNSSYVIISLGKGELVALLKLPFDVQ